MLRWLTGRSAQAGRDAPEGQGETARAHPHFLQGGGETGALMRGIDWWATPLGAPDQWPVQLQTLVGVMLAAHQPMFVAWGPSRILLYNDSYAALCQDRHPAAMGSMFKDVWADILHEIGPILDRAFGGEAVRMDDISFMLMRNGRPQEAHFAFSYTPVRDGAGVVHGVYCACLETTEQVLASRQAAHEHRQLRLALQQMPGFAALLDGPNHVFSYVNDAYVAIAGERDFIGRSVRQVFPELEGQGFYELLDRVYQTGEPFIARALPIRLNDEARDRYIDFLYHAVRNQSGDITGIFVGGYDATDGIRALIDLRESEARFRNMADQSPVMMWVTDATGACTYLNRAWYEFTGQSEADALGWGWLQAVHPDDREAADQAFAEAVQACEAFKLEYRLRRHDGEYRRAIDAASPRLDADGGYAGFIGSVVDVHDRLQAAEDAQARSEELSAIFKAVPAIIWVARDPDARQITGNELAASTMRLPDSSINMSKTAIDPAPASHFRVCDSTGRELLPTELPVQRAARGEVVRDFEEHIIFNDGATLDLLGNAMPLRRGDGSLRGAVAAFVDITERKRIEAELRAINDELESRVKMAVNERARLFAFSDDLFVTAEIGGRPIEVSDSWTRLLGWERKRLLEMPYVDLIHPDDRAMVAQKLETLQSLGVVAPYDNRVMMADGGWRTISWRLSIDYAGERIYGVGRDVTADRAQTKALAEAERRLYEVQKMESIGHLTGGVAHDFNNLLSAILSNLDIARKRVPDISTAKLIDGAIKGAERGAQLTKRLLAFARRQELKAEPVSLPQLVEGMRDLLSRSLGPSVRIVTQFPVGPPPVLVDANQLELALLNLAVNARDAMPDGGTLSISAITDTVTDGPMAAGLAAGDYVKLTVSDTGIGMDEATLARATEPFFTTKDVGKGTGLGLSMVHGLAAQTGGGMRIRSQPGQGVEVDLWLPRAKTAVTAAEPSLAADTGTGAEAVLTILLVDDDAMVSMGTAAMLEDLGHAVVEAHSGRAALDMLEGRGDIDLVITDHAMPGMTGAELARIIRDRRPTMPIIMATGYAEPPKGEAIDLPRLQKPLRQEELHRMLASIRRGQVETRA